MKTICGLCEISVATYAARWETVWIEDAQGDPDKFVAENMNYSVCGECTEKLKQISRAGDLANLRLKVLN